MFRRVAHHDIRAGYILAERVTRLLCPPYKFSDIDNAWHHDEEFFSYLEGLVGTQHSPAADRKYLLRNLCSLVKDIEGDIVECGSYRCSSAYIMADQLLDGERKLHIFDSFEGLSEPSPVDGSYWHTGDLRVAEQDCRRVLERFQPAVNFYKGWIPSRFPEITDLKFSLVHIDVDLYEPTRSSIEFLYPRMLPGAVLVLDDYGSCLCPGARAAADEFFASRPETVIHVPTGQGFVIKR